jgi:exosortase
VADITTEPSPFSPRDLIPRWPLAIAILVLAIPTFITLGKQVWSTEAGAHGPIVLATGIWILSRRFDELRSEARPGMPWLTAVMLAGALAFYVFGHAYDFISLEVAGLYGVCLSFLHAYVGLRAMIRIWFPLLYLGFIVPPPGWAVDYLTVGLKEFVSLVSTNLLQFFGLPISREGVTLRVAQYQLLVEDACSGMNSLIGLVAISLFYIYLLRNASWRYSLFLTLLVIPIAVVANMLRVITLVLLTYFFGDAVAQGFLHTTAGLFLFATALILVFAIDHLVAGLFLRRKGKPA